MARGFHIPYGAEGPAPQGPAAQKTPRLTGAGFRPGKRAGYALAFITAMIASAAAS